MPENALITAEQPWFVGHPRIWQENCAVLRAAILAHSQEAVLLPHPVKEEELDELVSSVINDTNFVTGVTPIFAYAQGDAPKGFIERIFLRFQLTKEEAETAWNEITAKADFLVNAAIREYRDDIARLVFFVGKLITMADFGPWPLAGSPYDAKTSLLDEIAAAQSLKGVFLDGRAVCQGFARALMLLCNRANIESWCVFGKMNLEGVDTDWDCHAWNMVMLDGKPFYVDVVRSKQASFRDERGRLCFPLLMDSKSMEKEGYRPFVRPFAASSLEDSEMRRFWYVGITA